MTVLMKHLKLQNSMFRTHQGFVVLFRLMILVSVLFSALSGLVTPSGAEAAGTSTIYSVYFRTTGFNSGLYVEFRANCSYMAFVGDWEEYVLASRGPLNGLWKVDLSPLSSGVHHTVSLQCNRDANHGVIWRYNVYFLNGSLKGTYRIGIYYF